MVEQRTVEEQVNGARGSSNRATLPKTFQEALAQISDLVKIS